MVLIIKHFAWESCSCVEIFLCIMTVPWKKNSLTIVLSYALWSRVNGTVEATFWLAFSGDRSCGVKEQKKCCPSYLHDEREEECARRTLDHQVEVTWPTTPTTFTPSISTASYYSIHLNIWVPTRPRHNLTLARHPAVMPTTAGSLLPSCRSHQQQIERK